MSEKYLGEEGTSRLIAKVKGYAQPRNLVSPVTIGGQSQTTVESALSALNNAKFEQVTSMPTASSAYVNKAYIYLGTTTASYKQGCVYICKSDGGDPATYSWELLTGDIPVDNTTIVKDGTTGELTAVQATNVSKGIVTSGDGTSISASGGVDVVNRLEETNALPTATSTNEGKCYLLKGTQSGYQTGAIYQCREVSGSDPAEYEWVLISANPLTFDDTDFSIANDNVELQPSRRIFVGTRDEWEELSVADKARYSLVSITDEDFSNYKELTDFTIDPNVLDDTGETGEHNRVHAYEIGSVVYVHINNCKYAKTADVATVAISGLPPAVKQTQVLLFTAELDMCPINMNADGTLQFQGVAPASTMNKRVRGSFSYLKG